MASWRDLIQALIRGRLPSQPEKSQVTFGDNARILETPATSGRGLAGRVGTVHGQTTPSITGLDVIGTPTEDYAVNVFFDDLGEGFWFADNVVEFVDHSPGSEITFNGVKKKWVRNTDGEWVESDQ
jgi:hypothetical protein